MAEKLITSRVKQRFDTLTNWQAIWATFTPLKGEVCKIQIPANTAVTGLRTSSSVRVMTKTGDGETTLENLPWDSAIGADETQLSKGTDSTTSKTLSHGSKFTAITETSVDGHKITDTTTTYTLPSETAIVTDQLTGTAQTPAHGGSISVVTAVAKGNSSHNVDVTKTTLTLPAETAVNVTATTGSALTPAHSGKVTVVTGVAKGTGSHDVKVTTQDITLPAETSLSKGTDATAASTLSHGGTFTAITETTVSGHKITDTTTTYTLPAETKLSKGTDATAAKSLSFGGTFTAVTDTAVDNHKITDTTTTFTMPSETTLSKGTDATAAVTLTHGGTFTAVTDTAVSGHKITDTTTTFTMPAETAISVDQGTATSSKPKHGETVTVLTGVTKGDSSHNIDVAKTTITFPSETTLSKATDATATTQTLSHGGTFTALTDLTVSGHAITDKPTTFTLPSETTLSVTDNESGNAVTDVTVSGHAITLKRGKTFLTAHPTTSVGTDSTSAATLAHSGTFTAVDSVTRDGNGHVTKINTKTYTLPADSDTKNTAGGGNTSSKIYLVGVTSQTTGTSYTHDTAYVGTDGCLYSGGTKVLTAHQAVVNSAPTLAWGTTSTVGTVGGTALTVKLPSNPNTNTAHTHVAGTGISLTGSGGTSGTTTIGLANSGVTAGSYGPSAAASPAHSGTFSVPYITVDATGRITSATTQTITLPAGSNTDTKVTQAAAITATTSVNYPVMLGYSTATTAVTNTLNKSAKLLFNTGTGALTVGTGSSAGSGSLTVDGNIIAGGGSDSYGILPKTSNYSNLGYYNKYWYRAYVSTVYCNNIKTLSGGTFSFPATITWNTF